VRPRPFPFQGFFFCRADNEARVCWTVGVSLSLPDALNRLLETKPSSVLFGGRAQYKPHRSAVRPNLPETLATPA
jgi:hypothetical protein